VKITFSLNLVNIVPEMGAEGDVELEEVADFHEIIKRIVKGEINFYIISDPIGDYLAIDVPEELIHDKEFVEWYKEEVLGEKDDREEELVSEAEEIVDDYEMGYLKYEEAVEKLEELRDEAKTEWARKIIEELIDDLEEEGEEEDG